MNLMNEKIKGKEHNISQAPGRRRDFRQHGQRSYSENNLSPHRGHRTFPGPLLQNESFPEYQFDPSEEFQKQERSPNHRDRRKLSNSPQLSPKIKSKRSSTHRNLSDDSEILEKYLQQFPPSVRRKDSLKNDVEETSSMRRRKSSDETKRSDERSIHNNSISIAARKDLLTKKNSGRRRILSRSANDDLVVCSEELSITSSRRTELRRRSSCPTVTATAAAASMFCYVDEMKKMSRKVRAKRHQKQQTLHNSSSTLSHSSKSSSSGSGGSSTTERLTNSSSNNSFRSRRRLHKDLISDEPNFNSAASVMSAPTNRDKHYFNSSASVISAPTNRDKHYHLSDDSDKMLSLRLQAKMLLKEQASKKNSNKTSTSEYPTKEDFE